VIEMKNLSNLERRITVLERPTADIDLLEIAINKLNDNELGLIEEYMSLLNAGFSLDKVSDMMGAESYSQALDIVNKIDQELERLTAPPVRQSIANVSKRRKRGLEIDHGIED
jgi:hypothetical protein